MPNKELYLNRPPLPHAIKMQWFYLARNVNLRNEELLNDRTCSPTDSDVGTYHVFVVVADSYYNLKNGCQAETVTQTNSHIKSIFPWKKFKNFKPCVMRMHSSRYIYHKKSIKGRQSLFYHPCCGRR